MTIPARACPWVSVLVPAQHEDRTISTTESWGPPTRGLRLDSTGTFPAGLVPSSAPALLLWQETVVPSTLVCIFEPEAPMSSKNPLSVLTVSTLCLDGDDRTAHTTCKTPTQTKSSQDPWELRDTNPGSLHPAGDHASSEPHWLSDNTGNTAPGRCWQDTQIQDPHCALPARGQHSVPRPTTHSSATHSGTRPGVQERRAGLPSCHLLPPSSDFRLLLCFSFCV